MSAPSNIWRVWLHGKPSCRLTAPEVLEMLSQAKLSEDTLIECQHDARGWTALRDYRESLQPAPIAQPDPRPPDPVVEVNFSMTQFIGVCLLCLGIIMGLGALTMDITVTASTGREINNIGLMNDRMVFMVAAGFAALIGTVMMMMGAKR
jgi:hypothetical protein